MEKAIKIYSVCEYAGHSINNAGIVNLNLVFDYSELTNVIQMMQLLNDETMNSLMSIMKELNIDHSGTVSEDTEGLAYIAGLDEVTEEMVLEEILTYIRNHPDNELEWVLEQAHSGIRV